MQKSPLERNSRTSTMQSMVSVTLHFALFSIIFFSEFDEVVFESVSSSKIMNEAKIVASDAKVLHKEMLESKLMYSKFFSSFNAVAGPSQRERRRSHEKSQFNN